MLDVYLISISYLIIICTIIYIVQILDRTLTNKEPTHKDENTYTQSDNISDDSLGEIAGNEEVKNPVTDDCVVKEDDMTASVDPVVIDEFKLSYEQKDMFTIISITSNSSFAYRYKSTQVRINNDSKWYNQGDKLLRFEAIVDDFNNKNVYQDLNIDMDGVFSITNATITSSFHERYFSRSTVGIVIPCTEEESNDVIENIDSYIERQKNIDEEKRQQRIAAAQKEAYEKQLQAEKDRILQRQKDKEIKKRALLELADEGLIYPTAKREPIPKDIVDAIWNRDHGKCVYCGSTEKIHIDHIIPFSKGGSDDIKNLQLLCQKCNLEKSNNIG